MEIKNLNNYYELVHLKFPELELSDIKRILLFGFKSLYLHNVYGGDVCISDNNFWMYIGNLTCDSIKHFKNYIRKLSIKIRILNKRLKINWDGYYYFGLSDKQQMQIEQLKNKRGRKRKKFTYGKVVLYKLLEECRIKESGKKYIYRIPFVSEFGYKKVIDSLISDKAELIETREPLKFKDILVTNNKYTYGGSTSRLFI